MITANSPAHRSLSLRSVAVLIALYIACYGSLLVHTQFLPYVFDNNESFSAFVHGRNLFDFGLSKSFGLTDEAYGPDPAAHPYVYTHQGNFPRLASFLMYALGARTVESQIAISTFSVGLGSVLLAGVFFARAAGSAVGILAALLFMSDYVLSVQWQVNTFKAWHGFLLFSMLVLLQAFAVDRRARWLGLLAVASFCVGYFDLLMAVFTFVLCAVYAWLLSARRPVDAIAPVAAMACGALVSVCLLLGQLIGYYGLAGLKHDLYLTFVGRNFVADDPEALRQWQQFFISHRIVFWEAFVDSRPVANIGSALKSVFEYGFSVFTPYLTFLIFALAGGPLVHGLAGWAMRSRLAALACLAAALSISFACLGRHGLAMVLPGLAALVQISPATRNNERVAWISLFALWYGLNNLLAVICLTNRTEGLGGGWLPDLGTPGVAWLASGIGLGFAIVLASLSWPLTRSCLTEGRRAFVFRSRVFAGAVYCSALGALALALPALARQAGDPIDLLWGYTLGPWLTSGFSKLCAAGTVTLVLLMIVRGMRMTRRYADRHLVCFFVAAMTAYLAAYFFSPGYMVLINLKRYTPVLAFLLVPLAAFAFSVAVEMARTALFASRTRATSPFVAACTSLVVIHLAMFWLGLQMAYAELIPPDQARPLAALDNAPYARESFVVNGYAAPLAAKTGQWAYINQFFILSGSYGLERDGFRPDGRDIYRWFADRDDPKYGFPSYAMCFDMPGFHHAIQVLRIRRMNPAGQRLSNADIYRGVGEGGVAIRAPERRTFACGGAFAAANIEPVDPTLPGIRLVDRDPSLLNRWSIYRLEDDFPPYLAPGVGDSSHVSVDLERIRGNCTAKVSYAYRQQQGKPESGSRMRAWVRQPGTGDQTEPVYEGPPVRELRVPLGIRGELLVAVQPKTKTREGGSYLSRPLGLSGC